MTQYKNAIIYLFGFAGVGKKTIAGEICKQADFRLIDNHAINNVVFPFVRVDSTTKMPQEIWQKTSAIRKIALDTMVEIGNRDFNFIFTNQLIDGDVADFEIYRSVEEAAEKVSAFFMPVRILCEADEHRRRISDPLRSAGMKLTRASYVDEVAQEGVLVPQHKNLLTLDVSAYAPQESAQRILEAFAEVYND